MLNARKVTTSITEMGRAWKGQNQDQQRTQQRNNPRVDEQEGVGVDVSPFGGVAGIPFSQMFNFQCIAYFVSELNTVPEHDVNQQ